MKQPKKNDSQIVGHARRELEIAGLFTANKENDYDGFIGKGVLALVKLFDQWTNDEPAKMSAVSSVFSYVIAGDLLSPPTNDPDEWEEFVVDGVKTVRNKRNIMYITRDDRKTWFNLRTEQRGICNDIETGKPLEGVEDPNGKTDAQPVSDERADGPEHKEDAAQDKESPADANDAGHGKDAELAATDSENAGATEGSQGVEAAELDAGVEQKSSETSSETEAPAEEPQVGEK
jgi:hypothetical protein